MPLWTRLLTVCLVLSPAFSGRPAEAAPIIFSGADRAASSSDPRPNAEAAAQNFDTVARLLGPIHLIDFESAPLGDFSSLPIAPGVTLTGNDLYGVLSGVQNTQMIRNVPRFPHADNLTGYNTTPGGRQWASMFGGFLTFSFDAPVQAFGAYLSGVKLDTNELRVSDGAVTQALSIPNVGGPAEKGGPNVGSIQYLGVTSAGAGFTTVTVWVTAPRYLLQGDIVGIDDVRFVYASPTAVPEPVLILLFATALLGAVMRQLSHRRSGGQTPRCLAMNMCVSPFR